MKKNRIKLALKKIYKVINKYAEKVGNKIKRLVRI
jgi:hypothetical protein